MVFFVSIWLGLLAAHAQIAPARHQAIPPLHFTEKIVPLTVEQAQQPQPQIDSGTDLSKVHAQFVRVAQKERDQYAKAGFECHDGEQTVQTLGGGASQTREWREIACLDANGYRTRSTFITVLPSGKIEANASDYHYRRKGEQIQQAQVFLNHKLSQQITFEENRATETWFDTQDPKKVVYECLYRSGYSAKGICEELKPSTQAESATGPGAH